MRKQLSTGLLLILLPAFAQAQVKEQITVPAPSASAAATPSQPHAPCCVKKGALIGLAIGVTSGLVLGGGTCEGSACASKALGAAAVLGVIGAGIGAMVAPSVQAPITLPGQRRVAVAPVLSRHAAGGIVAVRLPALDARR